MEKITEHYLDSFKPYIDELSDEKKDIFYRMINLQNFRYRIIKKRILKQD